jgi:integrase
VVGLADGLNERDNEVKAKAIRAAVKSLRSAGVANDQIEAALKGMGFDMAAAEKPVRGHRPTKTVSSGAQAKAKSPGVYRVANARRLYLKKTSYDSGFYFLRYRANGKRHDMSAGSIADVSLSQARRFAEEASVKLSKKVDLIAERGAERFAARKKAEEEARQTATPTVEAGITAYLEAVAPSWRHAYAYTNWFGPIKTYALPLLGRLKVDVVEPRHILMVMKAMDEKGVPVLAGKVRSRLKTMFDYLAAHGLRDPLLSNPADAAVVAAGRPKTETATTHYRRVAGGLDAAPGVFARLMALAPGNVAMACWVFMILTGARPGEAIAARWDQVDLAKKLWLNPAPKTKKAKKAKAGAKAETGDPLPVPLSDLALALLGMQPRTSDFLFPGRNGAKLVYTTFALAPQQAGVDAGAPHSWRSVLRDVVEDKLGFRPETAEAALGHSLGKVASAYRRETAFEARVPMMTAYADWLTSKGSDNVVALRA